MGVTEQKYRCYEMDKIRGVQNSDINGWTWPLHPQLLKFYEHGPNWCHVFMCVMMTYLFNYRVLLPIIAIHGETSRLWCTKTDETDPTRAYGPYLI